MEIIVNVCHAQAGILFKFLYMNNSMECTRNRTLSTVSMVFKKIIFISKLKIFVCK